MTAILPPSQGASLASAGRSLPVAPLDAEQAEGLSALWKSVFERARLAETSHDKSPQLSAIEREPPSRVQTNNGLRAALPMDARFDFGGVDKRDIDDIGVSLRQTDAAGSTLFGTRNSMTENDRPNTIDTAGLSFDNKPSSSLNSAIAVVVQPAEPLAVAGTSTYVDEARCIAAVSPHSAGNESIDADSVNVFVDGTAVSIVVRDAALSTPDAMRVAFDTARRLTGRSASLRQLTLNGQVLYRQRNDLIAQMSSSSVLAFAC